MYRHVVPTESVTAPLIGPGGRPELLSGPETAVLALADPGTNSRVILFVPGALELTCALLRRGTLEVTMVRVEDRIRAAEADVVIIPEVVSVAFLERAITCARRMLAPLGTITIRLGSDPAHALTVAAHQHLLLHGFTTLREHVIFGNTLIRAELPLYGRLARA